MQNLFKVGNTVTLRSITEDDDLDQFTEEYGEKVVITCIEDDNFWGVNPDFKVIVPVHMEYRDISDIEETNLDVTELEEQCEEVEKCSFCDEYKRVSELNKNGYCEDCVRYLESRGEI